jgi:hypothetical protein
VPGKCLDSVWVACLGIVWVVLAHCTFPRPAPLSAWHLSNVPTASTSDAAICQHPACGWLHPGIPPLCRTSRYPHPGLANEQNSVVLCVDQPTTDSERLPQCNGAVDERQIGHVHVRPVSPRIHGQHDINVSDLTTIPSVPNTISTTYEHWDSMEVRTYSGRTPNVLRMDQDVAVKNSQD